MLRLTHCAEWLYYGFWYWLAWHSLDLPRWIIHGNAWLRQPFYWIVRQGWIFPNLPTLEERRSMAVSRRQWRNASISQPLPLQDVIVAYPFDDEYTTDLAFMRADGTWMLTGSEGIEIKPILWQPIPALPANLTNTTPSN